MNKKIYIVILNFNVWLDSIECLESVIANKFENFQIILIDNFSPDNSEVKLKKYLDGKLGFDIEDTFFRDKIGFNEGGLPYVEYNAAHILRRDIKLECDVFSQFELEKGSSRIINPILLVQTNKNLGFAGGNNVALRSLIESDEGADVLLLNPDTFLDENALQFLHATNTAAAPFLMGLRIQDYKKPSVLKSIGGSRLIKPTGTIVDIKSYAEKDRLDYIYGGALFTDTSTLRLIGEMPEEYFLYWEESDWCYSAKQAGVSLLVCPKAVCYDKVGTSIGRGYLAEYFFTFNSMLFYNKHLKSYQVSLFFFHIIRLGVKLLKFRIPQSKAITIALKDYLFGQRYEVK